MGGPEYDSLPGGWLMYFVVFFIPSRQVLQLFLYTGYGRTIPNRFHSFTITGPYSK
jgi:hypothetical protein